MSLNSEYQAAASRITVARREPSPEEALRQRQEEAAAALRERQAAAYESENRRLQDEHIARVNAAAEADRQRLEQERVDAVRNQLRARFLALTGATEAQFEREFPALLREWQREQMRDDPVQREKAAMRASGRYNRF
ncbi:MAG: hypothetical protein M3Q03_13530 [Chloroflexota bacterium]|nr:hypothetical protein [Chloroflexota bacterium]